MRQIGTSNFTPNLIDSQNRQLNVDTNWTRGSHSVKFGYSLQLLQSYLTNPQQELGQFIFNGNFSRQTQNIAGGRGGRPVADFLLGHPGPDRHLELGVHEPARSVAALLCPGRVEGQ